VSRAARGAALAAACCLAALAAPGAHAHPRATSLSAWEVDTSAAGAEARAVVRVPWRSLQRALPEVGGAVPETLAFRADLAASVDAYLADRVRPRAGGEPCRRTGRVLPVASPDPTHFARRLAWTCPPGPLSLAVDLFHEIDPQHLHLARARVDGAPERDRVMVLGDATWRLGGGEGDQDASSLADYLVLGVEHIATGWDHLVFVLALLLTGTGVAQLATVVTGFTVAHSVTLALGVLGWVQPVPAAVEALIGLSIVVVACENFALTVGAATRRAIVAGLALLLAAALAGVPAGVVALPAAALGGVALFSLCYLGLLEGTERPETLRWFVALVFGLVHGFGFAGVLAETGLPPENVAPALLGFNLGVEAGQLAVVAVGWVALHRLLTGPAPRRARVIQWGSAPVLAVGLHWFLSRALAG